MPLATTSTPTNSRVSIRRPRFLGLDKSTGMPYITDLAQDVCVTTT